MTQNAASGLGSFRRTTSAATQFRSAPLPATLVSRSALHDRLTAGAGQRLTTVVGSAGAGKSVLLADWAAARPPGMTSWLSCDKADADAVGSGPRSSSAAGHRTRFGADAADLLAMDRTMSADVRIGCQRRRGAACGSAIVVDDFHTRPPPRYDRSHRALASETVQLVLAGRFDPPLRQHRLRMSGQLAEIRDRDLYFS
jgi:LuxR family maltose regulon positive regulatory protein